SPQLQTTAKSGPFRGSRQCLARLCESGNRVHIQFGAEQKDLGRVIDPHKNDDERACRAIARRHATASNIKADQMLADRKKEASDGGAEPNVLPFYGMIRKYLKNDREEHGREAKRERIVCDVQDDREIWQSSINIVTECHQYRASNEREGIPCRDTAHSPDQVTTVGARIGVS